MEIRISALSFEVFIERQFSNIISSVRAVNNNDYLNGHLKYLHDDIYNPDLQHAKM